MEEDWTEGEGVADLNDGASWRTEISEGKPRQKLRSILLQHINCVDNRETRMPKLPLDQKS